MAGFRRNRRRYGNHTRKLKPTAILAICVAVALAVSLTVGLLLHAFLDEDTYRRLTEQDQTSLSGDPIKVDTPDIHAMPFRLGSDISAHPQSTAASVSLNTPDGKMTYTSPVIDYYKLPSTTTTDFPSDLIALDLATPYVSGVFYPQTFSLETADLQFASAAAERAILREFIRSGGSEILLIIDSLSMDTLSSLTSYVTALKKELGAAPVGVAVPLTLAESKSGWEIIGTLLKSADFCALDLQSVEPADKDEAGELLKDLRFYVKQYDMRILAAESQSILIDALGEVNPADYQIITHFEKPDEAEPLP